MSPSIELTENAQNNGLAVMLSELLRQNLQDDFEKRGTFERMRGSIAIVATDANVAMTLDFFDGRLTVYDGIHSVPDIAVRADSESITKMSLMKYVTRYELPDLRHDSTRQIVRALLKRQIRIYGAFNRFALLSHFNQIMSVQE